MKKIRSLFLAALLTLTFAVSVSAGQIECGVTPPPPTEPREGLIEGGKLVAETVYTALQGMWMVF